MVPDAPSPAQPDAAHGLLVLDKPTGPTSRDVVNRVCRLLPRRVRVGHTGTLDPLASGVLVVCVGEATRLAEYVQAMGKVYTTTVRLGATSDTDDALGNITPTPAALANPPPTPEQVAAATERLVGLIEQVPPAFSAVHIAGQRAYDLARAGQAPTLTPRRVLVTRLSLLRYDYPELDLLVECGKGTYIRSLARDLGAALGCGGYVQTLRRTAVGPFTESMAVAPDSLDRASLLAQLQPMRLALAGWPSVTVDAAACRRLRQGQAVLVDCSATALTTTPTPRHVAVLGPDLALVAIGNVDARGWLRPLKVFAG